MLIELLTPANATVAGEGTPSGALWTGERHARDFEAVRQNRIFHAAMQSGGSLGTALTASAVTLTLYNPSGSPVNLALLRVDLGITTYLAEANASVATTYVLAVNVNQGAAIPATVTEATVRNDLLGSGFGYGKAYTVATLPAIPVVAWPIGSIHEVDPATAGNYVAESSFRFSADIAGRLVLTPNTAVTLQGIGTASSGIVSMTWEEVPIALTA